MLNEEKLSENEKNIVNKQLIKNYCTNYKIDVKYDTQPDFQDENKQDTVAMILTYNNLNIPTCWQHDPEIQNKYKLHVCQYQANNGRIPFPWTFKEIGEQNPIFKQIKQQLHKRQYIIFNNQRIQNTMVIHQQNAQCQICLEEGEQQFVHTRCQHKICNQCFQQLQNQIFISNCPVCRQLDWYYVQSDYLLDNLKN